MLTSRTIEGIDALKRLGTAWDQIWQSCSRGITGLDATNSSTWGNALLATHVRDSRIQTLLVSSDDQIVGLIPTFGPAGGDTRRLIRERRVLTQAYGGRTSLLVANQDPALVKFVLESLLRDFHGWDALIFSSIEGAAAHDSITGAARDLALPLRRLSISESPYLDLEATWTGVLECLPKKMRWLLRKSEKELLGKGSVDYEEFTDAASVPALLQCIYEVERRSWKEGAGSSITAQQRQREFYEALLPLAAEHALLSAHVLKLGGQPISYILGIAANDGTFLDLKESFDISFAEWSPGHVLKRFAIERLIHRGVKIYDFMGRCEPYKMRWTARTYRTVQWALYNHTVRGRLAGLYSVARRANAPAE